LTEKPTNKATDVKGVAEPSALLASVADRLFAPKQKIGNVTVAVAEIRPAEQQGSNFLLVKVKANSISSALDQEVLNILRPLCAGCYKKIRCDSWIQLL